MKYSSITILYNPNSTGDSKTNAEELERSLQEKGLQNIRLIATKHAGHAEDLAYSLAMASKRPLIISSSGDGGYNEVINGALRAQAEGASPTTCVIPSGNANDHYKQLHRGDTAEHIATGNRHHIDVLTVMTTHKGKTWKRFAHSYIGFGVTPEISKELNNAELNKRNEMIISLKSILKSKPFTIIKNEEEQGYQSIVMSNIAKMGKVLGLAKGAKINDGLFEVFALPESKTFMLGVIVKSATVGLRYTEQTHRFEFTTIEEQSVQCDGEVFDIKPDAQVVVGIEKRRLACIV